MKIKDFIYRGDKKNGELPDMVFIPSYREIKEKGMYPEGQKDYRLAEATDYARLNGAVTSESMISTHSAQTWLRDFSTINTTHVLNEKGGLKDSLQKERSICVRPMIRLDIEKILSTEGALEFFRPYSEMETLFDGNDKKMKFGEYPQSYVGPQLLRELGDMLRYGGDIKNTGKEYFSRIKEDKNTVVRSKELIRQGKKYAVVYAYPYDESIRLSSNLTPRTSTPPMKGEFYFCNVEPIVWKILNWDKLPKEINRLGDGTAKYIELQTKDAIISGLPFYPLMQDRNNQYWQNSSIRAYLNGINVNNITEDSEYYLGELPAPNGGNFEGRGFIEQALDFEVGIKKKFRAKKNVYGVKVLKEPMTTSEQIKLYIEKGKSFMLHGPSGVGKTRRIEEVDSDFVSIVLRNGMLPEEVIGKTIYPNGGASRPSVWMPPAWYTNLCKKCEEEPDENHVLFIDEITNVKPSEQSLVYNLVLTRSIGPNIGKLPKNVVVVAAGNTKQESEAAYNMPEPLFRRFEGHIELQPDVSSWLEWGTEMSSKGEGRFKIHPLVASFVATYREKVFYSPYDSEEPPKFAIDPRGWEQVSDLIYDNDGVLAREMIENKVGKEIANAFMAFAESDTLTIEDILDESFTIYDIPKKVDEQYALVLALSRCTEEEFPTIKNFVEGYLKSELSAVFIKIWVGESLERAIFVEGLKKQEQITL
ncbi:MAG: AAA family ATPase [Clostridia bacterium]|nr:AAA family ATPase [Clostridia bacterium]